MSKTSVQNKETGFLGENIAARYLRGKDYQILAQNYRKPWGEVDIIAEKEGVIVFCEVKTNSQEYPGQFSPELRVNRGKARRMIRAAKAFMQAKQGGEEGEWRIDIVSVTLDKTKRQAKIKHFENVLSDLA